MTNKEIYTNFITLHGSNLKDWKITEDKKNREGMLPCSVVIVGGTIYENSIAVANATVENVKTLLSHFRDAQIVYESLLFDLERAAT